MESCNHLVNNKPFVYVERAFMIEFLIQANLQDITDFNGKEEDFLKFLLEGDGCAEYKDMLFSIKSTKKLEAMENIGPVDKARSIGVFFGNNFINPFGHYCFLIENGDNLIFVNYHRLINAERNAGIGTVHLKNIEGIFKKLGDYLGKETEIKFVSVEAQNDTKSWLEKNGYKEIGVGYFSKEIL